MAEQHVATRRQETYVCLRSLRMRAFHGVLEQERATGNDYEISLRVGYPLERAMQSDDVADTLNYASVCELVTNEMRQPARLLEHVAARIVSAIEAAWPLVTSVDLTLTKLNPPMGADCDGASVELHVKRI